MENRQRTIGKPPAFPRETVDVRNIPRNFIAAMNNPTTLRKRVKHALLGLRYIH